MSSCQILYQVRLRSTPRSKRYQTQRTLWPEKMASIIETTSITGHIPSFSPFPLHCINRFSSGFTPPEFLVTSGQTPGTNAFQLGLVSPLHPYPCVEGGYSRYYIRFHVMGQQKASPTWISPLSRVGFSLACSWQIYLVLQYDLRLTWIYRLYGRCAQGPAPRDQAARRTVHCRYSYPEENHRSFHHWAWQGYALAWVWKPTADILNTG